jgi:hypothetical protein
VNLEEESSNTHGGLGILEIPSSIVNTFFLSILSSCFKLINSAFIINTITKTSKGTVHGTRVYSAGVGPKGPALERFPDIKNLKKKKKMPN